MHGSSTQTIRCAFCAGRGVDPFGLLSERSRCTCCLGNGFVEVPDSHVPCAYCRGSGSHKTYRCLVCRGTGVVDAPTGPTLPCPDCQGEGAEASSRLVCLRCKGRGTLPAPCEEPQQGTRSPS